MGMSLYDLLVNSAKKNIHMTKKKFGEIMHSPCPSEADIERALKELSDAGGYDNLPEED